jgi:hypothetical protein
VRGTLTSTEKGHYSIRIKIQNRFMKVYWEVEINLHAFFITYTVNGMIYFKSSKLSHPDSYLETH